MQQTDFADSFIKGMLGWIRWIASSIANLFQTGSGSGGMSTISWFADNWIKMLIGLIVVGVLIDWLVWMARWRPYWVWFRRRRILLDNDVQDIDDDDLMLHYGDMAPTRARRDLDSLELDDFDGARPDACDGFDEDGFGEDGFDEDEGAEDYGAARARARRYAGDWEDEEREDEGADEGTDEGAEDEPDFDELYDDRHGDYAARGREGGSADDEAEAEPGRSMRPPREGAKRRGLFKRARRRADAQEDPFSVEGDFFDDLGEDPMDDIVSPRAKVRLERDEQDTSVYQRPRLLPGDEPGAVRDADEEDGWHSGYTQRSAERGRRRKRDAGA